MTDSNQNFSKVCHIVDEYVRAVIFKNNTPRYLVLKDIVTTSLQRRKMSLHELLPSIYQKSIGLIPY